MNEILNQQVKCLQIYTEWEQADIFASTIATGSCKIKLMRIGEMAR